jgi:hypothetical protein
MKSVFLIALVTSLFAVPIASRADGPVQPLTRADVRADLGALEQAGYQPSSGEQTAYPADIQRAEQQVAQTSQPGADQTGKTAMDPAYGGETPSTASGMRAVPAPMKMDCVGPESLCQIYFGG